MVFSVDDFDESGLVVYRIAHTFDLFDGVFRTTGEVKHFWYKNYPGEIVPFSVIHVQR